MCGIAGFSGKFNKKGVRYSADPMKMRWLLHENESRGSNSTGIYVLANAADCGNGVVVKSIEKASEFILRDDVNNVLNNAAIVVGHTRAATVGSVTAQNAHPFTFGEKGNPNKPCVTGVHNGFVIEEPAVQKWIGPNKLFEKGFEVDSEIIFALLSAYGGDYKILSEIEGAIATAYVVPEKWPGMTFLYKREARDLHMGLAHEGIYYSSEDGPLKLINCSQIVSIPDNQLIILKDGLVYDTIKLDPPRIKSIKKGASRYNWDTGIPDEELEMYPELKKKSSTYRNYSGGGQYYSMSNRHATDPYYKTDNRNTWKKPADVEEESYAEDILRAVITDVKEFASVLAPEILTAPASEAVTWKAEDINACIIAITLINKVDKRGLAGFLLYDKANSRYCSGTAPNGVTALKYPASECGATRELIITDPVDGGSVFTYSFIPEKGRVLEVTLAIPFRKEGQRKKPSESPIDKGLSEALVSVGRTSCNLLPARCPVQGGSEDSPDGSIRSLQKSENNIHRESSEAQIFGDKGFHECTILPISTDVSKKEARGYYSKVNPVTYTKEALVLILANEDRTFKYKSESLSIIKTHEAAFMAKFLEPVCGAYINIKRLVADSAVIKLYQQDKDKTSWSLLMYGIQLLSKLTYRYKIDTEALTEERMKTLDIFCENFTNGRFIDRLGLPEVRVPEKKQADQELTPLLISH